jgi:hypothetical protein
MEDWSNGVMRSIHYSITSLHLVLLVLDYAIRHAVNSLGAVRAIGFGELFHDRAEQRKGIAR